MRLLQVITSLDPAGGGVSEAVLQLTTEAARLGHSVEIVTLDDPGSTWIVEKAGLSDKTIPVVALGPALLGYAYSSKLAPWLTENARRFDAAMVHGLWQYHGVAVRNVFRSCSIPYFVFPHGMLDPWFGKAYPLKHIKKLFYWFAAQRAILRDARGVMFIAEEERQLARSSFPAYRCNEIVVTYGISKPLLDLNDAREAFLTAFPALRDRRLFLFLGRIHPKKGIDLLIRAFGAAAADPRAQLVIAGPDQVGQREQLEALAASAGVLDRITWTGMLEGVPKWGAFAAAEAFVLPSHQENFGIAVVEALACGTPVLISNKINIWREIADDSAGMVAPDTLEGTSDVLGRWFALSESERGQFRLNAQSTFSRRFTIEQAAASLLSAVEDSR